MKRHILLFSLMLLAATANAQDLTGRTYACKDVEALREFVTAAVTGDSTSTGLSKGIDKGLTTFFRLCDMQMEFRFKENQQVQTHLSMTINDELAKKARLGWAKRQMVNLMLKTTVTGMNKTEPYTVENRLITTEQGNSMLLSESADSLEIGTADEKKNLVFKLAK